jgi:hypothetical protein
MFVAVVAVVVLAQSAPFEAMEDAGVVEAADAGAPEVSAVQAEPVDAGRPAPVEAPPDSGTHADAGVEDDGRHRG